MTLGKVIGTVVSDRKIDDYKSLKILIVQPVDDKGNYKGKTMFAVDAVQAGVGDTVVICDEGGSARMLLEEPEIYTIRTVVAGIVDKVTRDLETSPAAKPEAEPEAKPEDEAQAEPEDA